MYQEAVAMRSVLDRCAEVQYQDVESEHPLPSFSLLLLLLLSNNESLSF